MGIEALGSSNPPLLRTDVAFDAEAAYCQFLACPKSHLYLDLHSHSGTGPGEPVGGRRSSSPAHVISGMLHLREKLNGRIRQHGLQGNFCYLRKGQMQ